MFVCLKPVVSSMLCTTQCRFVLTDNYNYNTCICHMQSWLSLSCDTFCISGDFVREKCSVAVDCTRFLIKYILWYLYSVGAFMPCEIQRLIFFSNSVANGLSSICVMFLHPMATHSILLCDCQSHLVLLFGMIRTEQRF